MRIRTDEDYAYRKDVIEGIADFYDANKTKSLISAADDVPRLVDAAQEIIERDDLTHKQRQEIIETISTRHISFEVDVIDGDLKAKARFE